MKIEGAIEVLKSFDCGEDKELYDAIETIVPLLEKQIPRPVIKHTDIIDIYECTVCGEKYTDVRNYCSECGQALKWE